MNSKQLEVGDETEKEIGKLFKKNGYWCYITNHKLSGQPVDIIALKQNHNWLVDGKHLEEGNKSFPFSRIEPNQLTTMDYAMNFAGVKNLGFGIAIGDDYTHFYWLSYQEYLEAAKNDLKSVKIANLRDLQEVINIEDRN